MQKAVKIPLIIIGVFVVVIGSMAALKFCPPKGPWPSPPWCGEEGGQALPAIPVPSVGAGNAVEFTVHVPDNTPKHSVIFLEILTDEGQAYNTIEMEKKVENEWQVKANSPLNKNEIKYRYNRGNLGFTSAEEFSPDSKRGHRTLLREGKPLEVNDSVEKWRWNPKPGYVMPTIPSKAVEIPFRARVNGEKFQKGVVFVDFWWDAFAELLESTHVRLKEKNFEWIEIEPPWDYSQVNPLPVIAYRDVDVKLGHTYSDEQISFHLSKMREDGFKVYMSSQICCEDISSASFSDEWWDAWFEQYENYVLYFVDIANKNNIERLVISGDWFVVEKKPENYKQRLEGIYSRAKQRYQGKFGRLIFLGGTINDIHELYPNTKDTPFMDKWDFFSINMWVGMTAKNAPSQEELNSNVKKIFDTRLKPLYEEYKKPIVLQQIAYPSVDGGLKGEVDVFDPAISTWEPYSDKFKLDVEEQGMGYEAVMQAVAETDYITGVYAFAYWPDELPLTKEYNIRNKPAEEVLSRWYGSID